MAETYLETRRMRGTEVTEDGNLRATLKSLGWLYAQSAFSETVNHVSQGMWIKIATCKDDSGNIAWWKYQNSITQQTLKVFNK